MQPHTGEAMGARDKRAQSRFDEQNLALVTRRSRADRFLSRVLGRWEGRRMTAELKRRAPSKHRRLTPAQVARVRAQGGIRSLKQLAEEFSAENKCQISDVAVWKVLHRITYRDLP